MFVRVFSISNISLVYWDSFDEILKTWTRGNPGLEVSYFPLCGSHTGVSNIGTISGFDKPDRYPVMSTGKQGF